MAQFNKPQMHRKLQRDISVCYRVLKNHNAIADNRKDNDNPQRLKSNWSELDLATDIALRTIEQFWEELQEIRTEYARGDLDPTDISTLGRARLARPTATSNVLTNPQLNNGFTNESDFPSAAANKWEKCYEVNSAAHDTAVKLRSRAKYWRREWGTLQPDAEAGEMVALLRRINIASNLLKAFCEDIAERDNRDRNLGVRVAVLRKQVSRPAIDEVTGNLALLNADDVDAGDPTNELARVDPDIDYTRDVTELGTDTA